MGPTFKPGCFRMHPPTSSTTECTETGARYHEQFRIGTCTFKIFEVILQISYLLQEIFEKRRFSKNALKEIRANGRQWYRDMGDGIHNEDLHTLDAGLMGESGISSWPAVVVFRDAIIHAHGDIQTQEFMLAIAGCGSTQKNAIASNFMGPNHDIVISIAQFWGYGYYHFVHENLVRLPLLLNITAKFQQAMVQVIATNTFTMEYIQAFGVPRHRIFKGTFPHTLLESLQKLCYAPQLSSLRKRRWSSSLLTYPRR
mmetsp:Transcript_5782/g.13757  ORF Transcript_5782/g.13757 Transcript_5782/m.13757 type:complete len:256 (-) Transcript_5782:2014-2781(-)